MKINWVGEHANHDKYYCDWCSIICPCNGNCFNEKTENYRENRLDHLLIERKKLEDRLKSINFEDRSHILSNYFNKKYPSLSYSIKKIIDCKDDNIWSETLDKYISDVVIGSNFENVTLYGSRDSFIKYYSGSIKTKELSEIPNISSTNSRNQLLSTYKHNVNIDYLYGRLSVLNELFPTAYSTVDCIVYDSENERILLGRKPNENEWRLFGGFLDPEDDTITSAAYRELKEECPTIKVTNDRYIGNFKINDWRYKNTKHAVFTHLYVFDYVEGEPTAGDDIGEVKWFNVKTEKDVKELYETTIESHVKLIQKFIRKNA